MFCMIYYCHSQLQDTHARLIIAKAIIAKTNNGFEKKLVFTLVKPILLQSYMNLQL